MENDCIVESDDLAVNGQSSEPDMVLNSPETGSNPNEIVGINIEPFVGMIFESEVEAYRLYNEYSKQMRFGVRKKLLRRSKTNNELIAAWYICAKQGAYAKRRKTENPRPVVRATCPALLKVKRIAVKKWRVTEFVKEHSHELSAENARMYRSHKKAQATEMELVEIVNRNVGLRGSVEVVEKEESKFLSAVDTNTMHMHFMRMRSKDPMFYYAMDLDTEQRMRNALWVDAASKVAYAHFGDVVNFDTSYLTSRYKVPLATFTGVNHHGQSILFGCALLADETPKSYVWVFRTWLEAMSGRVPKALITDRIKSISAAVQEVFPETRHRFCLGHILRRVSERLGYVCRAQENFMKKLHKCIYDSVTENEFENRWLKFIHQFGLANAEWLQRIYDDRRQWALLYLRDTFFAGMSISQRGECLQLFFDKYVSKHTNLKEFLEKYELALQSRLEDEAQADSQSVNLTANNRTDPSPFELQMSNLYTKSIFEKFQAEVLGISSVFASKVEENGENIVYFVKAYEVQEDDQNNKVKEKEYKVVWNEEMRKVECICHLFEFKGYLCRHALAVLLVSCVLDIPSHYVLKRWTRDAKTRHVLNGGYNATDECSYSITQRFNDICVKCIKLAHEASLSKEGYEAALQALQEALEKVVYENNNPRNVDQHYIPRRTIYPKVSVGPQANNEGSPMLFVPNHLGTMFIVCDPQAFHTAGMSNMRVNHGLEKREIRSSGHNNGSNMQFTHNAAACSEVQLNQEQMVCTTQSINDASNDIDPTLSQGAPINVDDRES